jgi:hypothetical protein
MIVGGDSLKGTNGKGKGRGKERATESEYYRSTLYMCVCENKEIH